MHLSVVALIMLVSSISATPFGSLRARDSGICGSVGNSCKGDDAACCTGQLGFAFCNSEGIVDFNDCDVACEETEDSVSCI